MARHVAWHGDLPGVSDGRRDGRPGAIVALSTAGVRDGDRLAAVGCGYVSIRVHIEMTASTTYRCR